MKANIPVASALFLRAWDYVHANGHTEEVEWQRRSNFASFSEQELLREHAWVTLCSGFRESVVQKAFDHVSLCFCDWESCVAIIKAGPLCIDAALAVFGNAAKLRGIYRAAERVDAIGFDSFKSNVIRNPAALKELPYMGDITFLHLAKNLGLDVSKPDRHLVRASSALGFRSTEHFCSELAKFSGESEKVVDLVVWRYLADTRAVFEPSLNHAMV